MTYIFSYEHGYKPSNEIIETINKLLSIVLEDDEKGLRWYYKSIINEETIPWACHRSGAMNDQTKEPYFNILMQHFITEIHDKHKKGKKKLNNN
jgi:hypothetical protein